MKKKWIFCVITLVIFLIILSEILLGSSLFIDNYLINIMNIFRNDYNTTLFKIVTFFGSKEFIILAVLLTGFILVLKKRKGSATTLLLNMANVIVINQVIKMIVRRERPIGSLVTEDGFSFPSGHSMLSMAFYGFLIYLIHKSKIKQDYKDMLIAALSALIFMIGFSRIYLGVHYPSDVIGGFAITISYLIIYTSTVCVKLKRK